MNKALQNYECEGQLSFTFNGNIAPCPYIRDCNTYGIGCQGTSYWCKRFDKVLEPCMNPPEEPKIEPTDDYIKEHPTCFYVFGHYLDREDGWHKVPDELPTFTEWTTIDVVLFGKKTGTPWMEHGKWEAKDWTFRSLDERRDTESTEFLAWKVSD
jgi:hypothetical protein